MKLTNIEIRLLRDLFKSSEGLFVFTLYKRLQIPSSLLFQIVEKLGNLNLISSIENKLKLTEEGIKYCIEKKLSKSKSEKAKIPKEFIGPKIEINEFYLPKIKKNNEIILVTTDLGDI